MMSVPLHWRSEQVMFWALTSVLRKVANANWPMVNDRMIDIRCFKIGCTPVQKMIGIKIWMFWGPSVSALAAPTVPPIAGWGSTVVI